MAAPLLLVPLLTALLPSALPAIGRLIAGDSGASVGRTAAGTIEEVLRDVAGSTEEGAVRAALADPEKAGQVLLQLNTIAAQREKQSLDAKLEVFRLDNASQAGAREHTLQLSTRGSLMAWGAPAISLLVISCYAMVSYYTMTAIMPEGSQQLVIGLHESLKNLAAIVVGYWVGSSRGSAAKDEMRATPVARSAPVAPIVPTVPTAPVAPVAFVAGDPDETAEMLNRRLGGARP